MDVTSTEDAKTEAGRVRAGPGALERAMDATNGNGSDGAVADARPVVLVRAPDATSAHERPFPTGADYRAWGWPVTSRGDQVRLSLERDLVALIIPIVLATQVRAILIRQRCPPSVLAHPYAPEHQVLIANERYEVTLSWPSGVHRVTAALLLPPTMTTRGPITWVAPPQEDSLRQCREIDVRAAVRAALSDPPPPSS